MSYYPLEVTKDGIRLIEGIKCIINGTGERTQHDGEVRAVLRYLVTAVGRPTKFKTMMARPKLQSLGHDTPPPPPPLPPSPPPPLLSLLLSPAA